MGKYLSFAPPSPAARALTAKIRQLDRVCPTHLAHVAALVDQLLTHAQVNAAPGLAGRLRDRPELARDERDAD